MLASADSFEVTVNGRGGHAAWPHRCADPVMASAAIVQSLQTIVSREADPLDAAVVTVTAVHAGEAFNVIPDTATLRGTVRALREPVRAHLLRRVGELCERVAAAHGTQAAVRFLPGTPATDNDAPTFERFERVAREALGADRVRPMHLPVMGAEDFSEYGRATPACFFLLGQMRPNQAFPLLHDPAFDFNDDSMATGVEMLCRLALDAE
jgi:hippurate hydrolase